MSRPPPQSYLLRLWREHPGAPLHATLVPVARPDLQQHFGTLAECFAWLHEQSATPDEARSGNPGNASSIVAQIQAPEK